MKLGVFRPFQPVSVFRSIAICCNRLWNWNNPVIWVEHRSTILATGSAMVRTDSCCLPPLWHGFNPRPAHMVFVGKVALGWGFLPVLQSSPYLYHSAHWSILIPSCAPTLFVWLADRKEMGTFTPKQKQKNYEIVISEIYFFRIYDVVRNFVVCLFNKIMHMFRPLTWLSSGW